MDRESGPDWAGMSGKDIKRIQRKAADKAAERVKIREENPRILAQKKKQREFTDAAKFDKRSVSISSGAKRSRTGH